MLTAAPTCASIPEAPRVVSCYDSRRSRIGRPSRMISYLKGRVYPCGPPVGHAAEGAGACDIHTVCSTPPGRRSGCPDLQDQSRERLRAAGVLPKEDARRARRIRIRVARPSPPEAPAHRGPRRLRSSLTPPLTLLTLRSGSPRPPATTGGHAEADTEGHSSAAERLAREWHTWPGSARGATRSRPPPPRCGSPQHAF
jgi:hypothetical protein